MFSWILCSLLLAITAFVWNRVFSAQKYPLPPGPEPKFVSGNVHNIPQTEPWRAYADWSKIYGPVTYFRVFNRKYVVLNTPEAILDLLESRSSMYSDRPMAWMYKELTNRKMAVFNISFTHPRFRKYRTLLQSGLNSRVVQDYWPIQEQEAYIFLRSLLATPDGFISHIRRNAGAVILKVAYGWTVTEDDDYFVNLMKEAFEIQTELVKPGRWLVDVLPILRFVPHWFPGAQFKRHAAVVREQLSKIDMAPFVWAKENIASGSYVRSFTSRYLLPENGIKPDLEEEDIIKWCSGALYAGGADTTVAAMTAFFLLMALYPDIQQKAYDEIDRVIGTGRLPHCSDQDALPYIGALVKEVLRWAPVAPLGLPHRVLEADVYNGYRIPKGSTIIANIWALTRDPNIYPDPWTFNPERYLSTNGDKVQQDPRKYVFGFGRRICPGAHFAEVSLFLNISTTLAAFRICKPLDADSKEYDPEIAFSTLGATSHIKPFKCRILPRSADIRALLNEVS